MRGFAFFLIGVATVAGLVTLVVPAPGQADGQTAAPFVTEIPHGYRDWKWVSSAHEAGNLNSLGAVLGTILRSGLSRKKLPFPDGTIIAALHYRNVASDENNKVFGQVQSSFRGLPRTFSLWLRLKKIRGNRRLGFRSLRRRQTWRCCVYERLFSLPREGQGSDLVFTRYAP